MNDRELYQILREEVKPALGCTGPIAICFCAAQAYDAVGGRSGPLMPRLTGV